MNTLWGRSIKRTNRYKPRKTNSAPMFFSIAVILSLLLNLPGQWRPAIAQGNHPAAPGLPDASYTYTNNGNSA